MEGHRVGADILRGFHGVGARRQCVAASIASFLCLALVSGPVDAAERGIASMYGTKGDGYSGGRTASGERVNSGALTAAHRTLPFGSMVRVTNRRNNKSIKVRINDRGPFVRGRVIDLTPAGARALGFSGLAIVTIERI